MKLDNSSVVVVGGAGFLGSHLVDHLVEDRGCQVTVLDNLVVGRREFVHNCAKFEHCDITGPYEQLLGAMRRARPAYVFNYAAYPYIPVSFDHPMKVFDVNAAGAIKVIEAAQTAGAESIMQVSSAEIYGDGAEVVSTDRERKLDELVRVRPHSTYGVAKAAVDYYCQTAWRERKTPVTALRQFNCVGARETHPYVLPEIINQVMRVRNGEVHLGNNSVRDFINAKVAVRCAVKLAEAKIFGEVFNLGSEHGVKIYDLATEVGRFVGQDIRVVHDKTRDRPWEIWHLQSNNRKIESAIGKVEYVPLSTSINEAVGWFNANGREWPWENKCRSLVR